MVVQPEPITETLEELRIENDVMESVVAAWLANAEDRRGAVVLALSEDRELVVADPGRPKRQLTTRNDT